MKKIIALVLVCLLAVSFVACGGNEENESSSAFQTSSMAEKSEAESSAAEKSEAESSTATEESTTSTDESATTSEGETSTETSEGETSEDEGTVTVEYTNKYVSWKVATGNGARVPSVLKADDAQALKLSKINEDLADGDNGAFTYTYGRKVEIGKDFAVVVAEYDHETFSYVRKEYLAAGEDHGDVNIPKDGFVIAVWKDQTDKINGMSTTTNPLFPHGFTATTGLDAEIKAAKTTPTIDGKVDAKEYGNVIWDVTPSNTLVSYAQFEKNNYFATAKVYMSYDKDNLYLAVVVDSPIHDNDCTASSASGMYDQTSIQVNFGSCGRDTDYIDENWDWGINPTSTNENRMRQYGFCLNPDSGEQFTTVWQGDNTKVCDTFCVTREGEITTYEVALPWSHLNGEDGEAFAPKKGDKIQLAVSFNLGGKTVGQFKNVTLRDGGGIIGINDWTKIPTITLD